MFGRSTGGDGGSNVFASNKFGSSNVGGGASGLTPDVQNQIITTVKQDMETWEKSGQWAFSCYSCAKDCASVPGLTDLSPEELRHEAYLSFKAGNTDYQTKVAHLTQEYRGKRSLLSNPDPQLKLVLLKIYAKEPTGEYVMGSGPSSIFASGAGTNQQQAAPGVFGAAAHNTGLFGGGGASKSLFGGSSTQQPPAAGSLFGGSASFGGSPAAQGGSIFGGAQTSTPSTFGQPPAFGSGGTGGGIFGGGQGGGFGGGAAPSTGIFGGGAQTNTAAVAPSGGGLFSQPPASGIFGQSSAAPSVFGQASAPSSAAPGIFGQAAQQPPQQGLFGSSTATSTPTPGLFGASTASPAFGGGSAAAGPGVFGSGGAESSNLFTQPSSDLFNQPQAESGLFGATEFALDPVCVYSTLQELTQEDINAYKSDSFQAGCVPVNPPTQDMCAPVQ